MTIFEERRNLDILSTNILMEKALDKILIAIERIEKIILDFKYGIHKTRKFKAT